jgi:hypothetical protein
MTKKRFLLLASVPLAIVVTLGVLAMLPPRPGVTKANFDRIEKGMTLSEVEQLLGRPGTYTWGGYYWRADGATALVEFNFNGDSAGQKSWQDSRESTLDKIRRWLHLPKG